MNTTGFNETLQYYSSFDVNGFLSSVDTLRVGESLKKEYLGELDFLSLLSLSAAGRLEEMAFRSKEITERNFGKVISLYAPIYLSNYCENECLYCGFNAANRITRKRLTIDELIVEAEAVAAKGIRHVLILTGESRKHSPVSFIKDCVGELKRFFPSISIEVYPLKEDEYKELAGAGVDGLALYQETYDRFIYADLHPRGPKSDFNFRLDAPERACRAGMRGVNAGVLLGLADFRKDVFLAGLHAKYLEKKYPSTDIGISLPRFQPEAGGFVPALQVSDTEFVQCITALRLFLPKASINISTREDRELRGNLIGLGVTRMSAGSRTEVGGYSLRERSGEQFSIADKSTVEEVREMIISKGYQPVMKDWEAI